MKRILSLFICLLTLAAGLLLQGCSDAPPITFSSVLSIEADESGCRTMQVNASKKTLESLFGSKTFSFQSFISANCPEAMEWSYVETAAEYQLSFQIPFSSLEEYQELTASLTGSTDFTTISRPQVGVKTGFTLTEQDALLSLFTWFTDAMTERTGMSYAQLSPSLSVLSNELVFNERSYPKTDHMLRCSAETFLDAQRIDILTRLSLEGWERQVFVVFPAELMDNASNVKKYLESLLPDTMEASWENNTTWCLRFSAADFTELGTVMRSLFQTTDSTPSTESATAENSMRIVHAYQDPINFSFFVPNTGITRVRYFVGTETHADIYALGPDSSAPLATEDYPDYQCIFDSRVEKNICYNYDAVFQYQPSEIFITTRINSIQLFDRSFELLMGEVPGLHQKLIFETFSKDARGCGIVSQQYDETGYRLIFSQVGTPRHLAQGFWQVFHGAEVLDYNSDSTDLFRPTHTYTYTQEQDYSDFLAAPEQTILHNRLIFPVGISIREDSVDTNLVVQRISGSSCNTAASENYVRADLLLSLSNPAYYFCLMAMLTLVSVILYSIYKWLVPRR